MNEIHLKPFTLDEYGTIVEQLYKITEEVNELDLALIKGDKVNAIEEFYDVIQVMVNILDKIDINTKEIESAYFKHHRKLLGRGWEFKK